jgi:hypothetical protein
MSRTRRDRPLALQKSIKTEVSRIADPVRLRSVLDFINSGDQP